VLFLESELSDELENFVRASKDGVASLERSLAEKSFEDSLLSMTPSLPFTIRHGHLVQVSKKGVHPVELLR
jgi:hypothetical protein